jgi:uncharacterized repeat protein (TIGR04076 family)
MECPYCTDSAPLSVRVAHIHTKCKYHPCVAMAYGGESCAPAGLCRELFHAAYPECLSLLYGGRPRRWRSRSRGQRQAIVTCPARDGVTLDVRVKDILPAPLRMLKELAEEACKAWFRPVDAHLRRVVMTVAATGPACPKAYRVGRRFEFNTHRSAELCPAGFEAVYPYVRHIQNAKAEDDAAQPIRVHCPDHAGVIYEVAAGERTGGGACLDFSALCRRCNAIGFSVRSNGARLDACQGFPQPDLCPLARHSIYAYVKTLASGGWFNWVGHGKRVIVHCPSPAGVAFEVGEGGNNGRTAVEARILTEGKSCPMQYAQGQRFIFATDAESLRTMEALDRALPLLVGAGTGAAGKP